MKKRMEVRKEEPLRYLFHRADREAWETAGALSDTKGGFVISLP